MADSNNVQAIFSKLVENRHASATALAKKRMTESRSAAKKTAQSKKRFTEGQDDVMDDVIDNIAVVTDPKKNVDDLENRADDIQQAIEDTPEGEAAFSDEYIGDNVYACPICGESFFADETYQEGDACPVCQAEPSDGFLNQGVVAAPGIEDDMDDFEDDLGDEGLETGDEGLDIEPDVADEEEKPEGTLEAIRRSRRSAARRRKSESAPKKIKKSCKEEYLPYELDDESFNNALTEFVTENYGSSVKGMKLVRASYSPKADTMKLECRLTMKEGKKVPAVFIMREAKNFGNRSIMTATEATKTFKIESRRTPAFKLDVRRAGKVLACESITYNYVTKHNTAGRVQVEGVAHGFNSGRSLVESNKPARDAKRANTRQSRPSSRRK